MPVTATGTESANDVAAGGGSPPDIGSAGGPPRGDACLSKEEGMPDTTQTISSESGGGAAEAAQDKAKEVASQAQDKAREAAGQARGRVRDQVDQRSTRVGDQVGSSASDARSVAEHLRSQGKETPARYVEQAADRAELLGGYLRESDGDRLLNDVEDFARRNTWAVALGGLALGFAASRLLKASSSDRYRSSLQSYDAGADISSSPGLGAGRGQSPGVAAPNGGRLPSPDLAGASHGTRGSRPGSPEE
jgi:hypothetical protein